MTQSGADDSTQTSKPLKFYGDKMTVEEAWERMFGLKNLSEKGRSEYTIAYSLKDYPPQEFTDRSIRLTKHPIEKPREPLLITMPGWPTDFANAEEDNRLRSYRQRTLSRQTTFRTTWNPTLAYDEGATVYRRDFSDPTAKRWRTTGGGVETGFKLP
jgi:hypothetical protein